MTGVVSNRPYDKAEFNTLISNLVTDINNDYSRFNNRSKKSLDKLSELTAYHFAQTKGLTLRIIYEDWKKLCHQDYPSIVKYRNGRYLVLIKASDRGVLLYDQSDMKTSIVSKGQFLEQWSGRALSFKLKPEI